MSSACVPENFINREYEIGLVVKKVSDLVEGKPFAPKERVFHFVGPSGIGKSCLLEKCKGLISKTDCVPLLIQLDTLKGRKKEYIDELLNAVHAELCQCKDRVTNKEHRNKFSGHVQRKISEKNQIIVLLLDEVNVPIKKDMEEIESRLLENFIKDNDRTILVTAGRSQPAIFNDFALRPDPSNIFPLPPFDEDKTRKQIESLKPGAGKLTGKITKLGSGVPGNTVKLLEHISGDPLDIPNESKAVQSLLDKIKETNDIKEHHHPMLEAISILQGFFQEDVVPLFQKHPQLGNGWDEGKVKGVFQELNRIQVGPGGLVDWDREKKHWAMDESTRDLFEKELQMRNLELWKILHCTALEMYQEWGQKYNSDMYRNKSKHHQQRLQSAEIEIAAIWRVEP